MPRSHRRICFCLQRKSDILQNQTIWMWRWNVDMKSPASWKRFRCLLSRYDVFIVKFIRASAELYVMMTWPFLSLVEWLTIGIVFSRNAELENRTVIGNECYVANRSKASTTGNDFNLSAKFNSHTFSTNSLSLPPQLNSWGTKQSITKTIPLSAEYYPVY